MMAVPYVRRSLLATILLCATVLSATQGVAEPLHLRIVHVNDFDRMEAVGGRGGFAKYAAVVNAARSEAEHVLVTHGGDAISPSLLSGIDGGAHIIDLLNQVGLDAFVLGNHEFDFGPEVMVARVAEANFPVLAANAAMPDGTLPTGVLANVTYSFGDWTIGLFGVVTPDTALVSSPDPVRFLDILDTAAAQVSELTEAGADFVIALAHTSIAEDNALIAQGAVPLILGGHDHDLRLNWRGATAFLESASQADYVAIVDLLLDRDAQDRVVWNASYRFVDTVSVDPDETLAAAVAAYEARLDEELGVAIGTTETALSSERAAVRGGENALGSLIAEAMRAAVGADVGITNGGGIRANRVYDAGTVLTRRDILAELPFGNRTVLLEVTGADLLAALENGFSQIEDGAGRFPQVAGMTVEYAPSRLAGQRVVSVSVGGVPLDPLALYAVATNDFMARGGDGYAAFAGADILIDGNAGDLMASQVIAWIEAAGTIAPVEDGRLTIVD